MKITVDMKHLIFKHLATLSVTGPSGCGKTVSIRRLIKHHNLLFYQKDSYSIATL